MLFFLYILPYDSGTGNQHLPIDATALLCLHLFHFRGLECSQQELCQLKVSAENRFVHA